MKTVNKTFWEVSQFCYSEQYDFVTGKTVG